MSIKKWAIVLGLVVMVGLVLTACGETATSGGEETTEEPAARAAEPEEAPAAPAADPGSPWDVLYQIVPPELCPHYIEPVDRPRFVAEPTFYEDGQVWVQHGLFPNEQGELFRMNVIGLNEEPVQRYSAEVRVCLDQVLTGATTTGIRTEPGSGAITEKFGAHPDDLIIEVYLVGIFDPQRISGDEVIDTLFASPAPEWGSILRTMGMAPHQARPEEPRQDYVVDFALDPYIDSGVSHFYPDRSAMYAITDVSVAPEHGLGSVGAELFRNMDFNMELVDDATVERGIDPETKTLKTDILETRTTHSLTVYGRLYENRYQIMGRKGRDAERGSWVSDYQADPPPCTPEGFCLEQIHGQSVVLWINATTPETPIPKMDVLLLFDVTSSMEDEIEEVKKNASFILDTVTERVDTAFGIASFADYPAYYDYAGYAKTYGESGDYPWSLDLDMTDYKDDVQWVLDALELRSGGDEPESYSRALFEALSISWRPQTKKVIVLFGDAMAHDYEFFPETFGVNTGVDPGEDGKAGTPDDLFLKEVVEDLRWAEITVIPINSAPGDELVKAFFEYVASETGGQVYDLATATEAPEAVLRGLEAATAWINQVTISTEPDFAHWVTTEPAVYYDVGGGEDLPFEVTVTVPEEVELRLHEFTLYVLADGSKLDAYPVVMNVR